MAENQMRSGGAHFAEYSLWNDSCYSMFSIQPYSRIEFMRPVAGSIFLSPGDLENKDSDDEIEEVPPEPAMGSSSGFERYMKRALKVVTREDLERDPALFRADPDSDESDSGIDHVRDREIFLRPPRPRWRTAQQVNGRGRRLNLMQRRLEEALSQPARIERGESMLQRMGWQGGALGRGGGGITEPIAPDPYCVRMLNAAYEHTTAGFGLPLDSAGESSDSDSGLRRRFNNNKSKKQRKQDIILNILQYICEFVKNDLQVELFFEMRLHPKERRLIHQVVSRIMDLDAEIEFDRVEMLHLVSEIKRRNAYTLGTISNGETPTRQICVYKQAPLSMFLITPDDVRFPQPDDEEETNPFLKSIARHVKEAGEYTMLDRIIDFFVEFSEKDEFNEFRFLGAFNIAEIDVLSSFFGMVSCIVEKRPYLDYPERLVKTFEKDLEFTTVEDANGFVSIRKKFKDGKIEVIELD